MTKEKDQNMEFQILETAEKLFLEKGFAMTTTTAIAKEIGCNQALVHYYYRTKEKLFEAIFEKKVKMLVSPFLSSAYDNLPFEERLKMLIEAHYDILKSNPKIPFLFLNELLTNPKRLSTLKDKLKELPQTVLKKMGSDLKKEIEKGTIRPMKTVELLMTIISLNLTVFLMSPILKTLLTIPEEEINAMIEMRKSENVLIVLRSLKP